MLPAITSSPAYLVFIYPLDVDERDSLRVELTPCAVNAGRMFRWASTPR